MELMRRYLLELLLKNIITTSTSTARPMLSMLPNVPAALAASPPPQALMPTFMRLRPISVTTMPDTRGVIILRVYFNRRLMIISTEDAAMHEPNMSGSPPASPALIMGPMNEKLVPCTHSSPVPINPKRRHWMKVETPEANRAIDTRKPVVSTSSESAPDMMSGGVIMATNMASRCCKAANSASFSLGLSSRP